LAQKPGIPKKIVAWCYVLPAQPSSARPASIRLPVERLQGTGTMLSGDTFSPPSAGASPALSATEAFGRLQSVDPQFRLRAGSVAFLGMFSGRLLGIRLAWGYRWYQCGFEPNSP